MDGPDGWTARAFANRHPALTPDAEAPPREASLDLFTSAAARGHHEVIVNTARAVGALAELTTEELAGAAGLWRARMAAHGEAAHVHLHVNEGADGGASQPHSHAQLWALDFVPAAVARERERCAAYSARSQGSDLLGDLVQAEVRLRERLVAYDDEAVLLAPYASRVPYQLMLVPRTPTPRFETPGVLGAALLHRGLRALARSPRRLPAAHALGAHRPPRCRALLLADRRAPAPVRARWPRARDGRAPQPGHARTCRERAAEGLPPAPGR